MKEFKISDYSLGTTLISSILFLVLGIVLYTNPGDISSYIPYVVGIGLIIWGIINIILFIVRKKKSLPFLKNIIIGFLLAILGTIFMISSATIYTTTRIIIGSWIIFWGINRLISAFNKKDNKLSLNIILFVLSLLLITCGVLLIAVTSLMFKSIGILIIIFATLEIIGYIYVQISLKKTSKENKKVIDESILEIEKK